jgi:hypothetical protein
MSIGRLFYRRQQSYEFINNFQISGCSSLRNYEQQSKQKFSAQCAEKEFSVAKFWRFENETCRTEEATAGIGSTAIKSTSTSREQTTNRARQYES